MAANVAEIVDTGRAEGVIVFTPSGAEMSLREVVPRGFKLFAQRGETLGDRLSNATEDLLHRGFHSLCLIKCDSPTLPRSLLEVAIESLGHPGDRIVLGTAADGGYYLIGLKKPHRELFDRIARSRADVLAHTTALAAKMGLKVEVLPRWYNVDEAQTLDRLCGELFGSGRQMSPSGRRDEAYYAPYTRQYLAKLIERAGPRIWPGISPRS